jgi:transglutaminase-like putative cysteine protease
MFFRPLSRFVTRTLSALTLIAWVVAMAVLVVHAYGAASPSNLATDLARYGSGAVWRGVYYRGEKIGFTVSQTVPTGDGFELEEDGRLQMSLLGAISAATVHTSARVDQDFALRSFEFKLDPGTGPVSVTGSVAGRQLTLGVTTRSGSHSETRELAEPPALAQNLSRKLADGGLTLGARHQWMVFDPATLRNAPVTVSVGKREVVRGDSGPIPAFRVEMEFSGLRTTSWITDTGEVVREESPLGLITVRETADRARAMAVPGRVQADLLEAAAVVPVMTGVRARIDEARDVRRLRVRLDGVDLPETDLDGVGQTFNGNVGNVIDIRDPQALRAGPADREAAKYLAAEPLIESDAPEIRAEAETAIGGATDTRLRAERLTRHVNALLEKKPTVGLPSAREVLRTRVGDCNEHTALFVAMARSLGIPSRIAVGLVHAHGAFYYHAWPEVYIDEAGGRGYWLPVDPTLNEFPADGTHIRLARGGLDKQTAILPLVGRLKMTVLDLELAPNTNQVVVGKSEPPIDLGALAIPIPQRESCCTCDADRQRRTSR